MFEKADPAIWVTQRPNSIKDAFSALKVGDIIEVPYQQCHSSARLLGIRVQVRAINGKYYAKRVI